MTQVFGRELNQHVVYLNRRRRRYMDEHLRVYGLAGPMYCFLICIEKNTGISQDYLANFFDIDKGTVAHLAKRLEELAYIRRQTCSGDRRLYELALTDQGREILRFIHQCLNQWSEQMLDGFSEAERATAMSLLRRMTENINILKT